MSNYSLENGDVISCFTILHFFFVYVTHSIKSIYQQINVLLLTGN